MHPLELPGGCVTAELPNPAVKVEVFKRILELRRSGLSDEDIIKDLQNETVPPGFTYYTWAPGNPHKHTHP